MRRELTSEEDRLRTAMAALEERVDRELGRLGAASTEKSLGTEHVGGVARVAAKLEEYLRAVAEWVCSREGLDVQTEFDRVSGGKHRYRTETMGQLGVLLEHFSALQSASQPAVVIVCQDSRQGPRSVLRQVTDLRNKVLHGREEVSAGEQRRALEGIRRLLKEQYSKLATASET